MPVILRNVLEHEARDRLPPSSQSIFRFPGLAVSVFSLVVHGKRWECGQEAGIVQKDIGPFRRLRAGGRDLAVHPTIGQGIRFLGHIALGDDTQRYPVVFRSDRG